jgi:hypothetical protein
MKPAIWGHCAWEFTHIITLNYPDNPTSQDKLNYFTFFDSLQYVLPCEKCQVNLTKHFQKYPLTPQILSSKESLVTWWIDIHNLVNHQTGKQLMSYDDAINTLQSKINNADSNSNTVMYLLVLIVIIILIIFGMYRFKSKN